VLYTRIFYIFWLCRQWVLITTEIANCWSHL